MLSDTFLGKEGAVYEACWRTACLALIPIPPNEIICGPLSSEWCSHNQNFRVLVLFAPGFEDLPGCHLAYVPHPLSWAFDGSNYSSSPFPKSLPLPLWYEVRNSFGLSESNARASKECLEHGSFSSLHSLLNRGSFCCQCRYVEIHKDSRRDIVSNSIL